jgi:hypothetical protein
MASEHSSEQTSYLVHLAAVQSAEKGDFEAAEEYLSALIDLLE